MSRVLKQIPSFEGIWVCSDGARFGTHLALHSVVTSQLDSTTAPCDNAAQDLIGGCPMDLVHTKSMHKEDPDGTHYLSSYFVKG